MDSSARWYEAVVHRTGRVVQVTGGKKRSLDELVRGLDDYLVYGYVDELSIEDPEDDAFDYLSALISMDRKKGVEYCKLILEGEVQFADFLKPACLDCLLLSEDEWRFAFSFLQENSGILTAKMLEKAVFYFYCASRDAEAHPVPSGLFDKLVARYRVLGNEPDASFYDLQEVYGDFLKAYSLEG
ncbi:hypothetical protein [Pseudomonas sp. microsymbiont 2]